MNKEVADSNRRLTVICDPHIKVKSEYFVYKEGTRLEEQPQPEGNFTNIFVKMAETNFNFLGICWSGISVWIDFLNENA